MKSHEQPWVTLSGMKGAMSTWMKVFINLHDRNIRNASKFPPGSKFNLLLLEEARKNKEDFTNFVNGLRYES